MTSPSPGRTSSPSRFPGSSRTNSLRRPRFPRSGGTHRRRTGWGTPPLLRLVPPGARPPRASQDDFQGDDMGESGDDFGLELSEGTPAPLSRSGPRPVPVLSRPELVSPAAAASSPTTGAIPLPPEPPGLFQEPTVSRARRGPFRMPPAIAPGETSPVPGALRPTTTGAIPLPPRPRPRPIRPLLSASPVPGPRADPPRRGGPVPLPPASSPARGTPSPAPWQPPARRRGAPRRSRPTSSFRCRPRGGPGGLPPEPSPSLEPLPWTMPASSPATTPSRGAGPVPLPVRALVVPPPAPRVPAASAAPPPVAPISPPSGRLELTE